MHMSIETNLSSSTVESSTRSRPPNHINDESLSPLVIESGNLVKDELKSNSINNQPKNENMKIENGKYKYSKHLEISTVHPTSYLDTLINLLKVNIGCGILAMGDAFKNGGLFLSPVLTFFIAIISVYNQHLLVTCSRNVKKNLKLKYNPEFAETVELAFQCGSKRFQNYSGFIRKCVTSLVIITQLGFSCVYVIFVSKSIQQVAWWYNIELDMNVCLLIGMVPIMISSLIRNLKFIARLSAVANISTLTGLFTILYYCSIDLPPLSTRAAVGDWRTLPLYFGTSIFTFEGISLILPLEQEMKKPKQFSSVFGVLNVGMVIVTTLIIITGFMGYLRFGDGVRGSLTLNLPEEFILARIVVLSMMFSIICSYTLQIYLPVEIIWPVIVNRFGPFKYTSLLETAFRIVLVLITIAAAALIPHLGLFISMLGSVAGTLLALTFPPLCHLAVVSGRHDPDRVDGREFYGPSAWRLSMDAVTLTTGAIGFVTGTYVSFGELSAAFRAGA